VADTELEGYRQQFQQIRAQAAELTAGLKEDQFNWRPAAGVWSIEECLSHLVMVGQSQVRDITDAVDQAHARGIKGSGPFDYGHIDRFIVGLAEPPVRQPLPAPQRFHPLHGQPITAILPTFNHVQDMFVLQADRAEGLDLARIKVPTPISPWLKMSLGMVFKLATAHERRHIEQARRVRVKLFQSNGSA
jgi:hypothetical protein